MKKNALVIGATGLVGRQLVLLLLDHPDFDRVTCFVRRSMGLAHAKLQEEIVDFDQPETWKHLLRGDVLFSCMGTTLKAAGSQEAQWRIDYDYQFEAARQAAENGVPTYVLVSAAGADAHSRLFYNRMKGQLDEAVASLPFQRVTILRPSILDGDRKESRPGEKVGLAIMKLLRFIPGLRSYRPIHVRIVAHAMLKASLSNRPEKLRIVTLGEIFELAKENG